MGYQIWLDAYSSVITRINQGGVERGTVELINRELVKRGHQSSVISLGGKQVNSIVQDGGNHYTLKMYANNNLSKNPLNFFARVSSSKLRKLLQTIEPDILHARSRRTFHELSQCYINQIYEMPHYRAK